MHDLKTPVTGYVMSREAMLLGALVKRQGGVVELPLSALDVTGMVIMQQDDKVIIQAS